MKTSPSMQDKIISTTKTNIINNKLLFTFDLGTLYTNSLEQLYKNYIFIYTALGIICCLGYKYFTKYYT